MPHQFVQTVDLCIEHLDELLAFIAQAEQIQYLLLAFAEEFVVAHILALAGTTPFDGIG